MSIELQRVRIEKLYGNRTIDIPISDNKLILVGENGTGKSTVANFIYFVLTEQWWRMRPYDFEKVSIWLNSQEITVTKDDIRLLFSAERSILGRRYPQGVLKQLDNYVNHYGPEALLEDPSLQRRMQVEFGSTLSPGMLREYLKTLLEDDAPLFNQKFRTIAESLKTHLKERILYLPTYRRIEKELEFILRKMDVDIEKRHYSRSEFASSVQATEASHHIELVEFGMKDVEGQIKRKLDQLKDDLATSLNNLTVQYLREVVLGTYDHVDLTKAGEIDASTVEDIFSRVGTDLLSPNDKDMIIEQIRKNVHHENRVVAHFLLQLNELYRRQRENEAEVEEFVDICNAYLVGKKIEFDGSRFRIDVHQYYQGKGEGDDRIIELKDLSSGEKQILSLFSHFYLSGSSEFFVIIDEPELSLSVPWQKRFLPDIVNSGRSTGFIAVTHSPFIFDNELKSYVLSLEDFVELI